MKLSIIIPTYNEEGNIEKLHEKITKTCENLKYEMIFINDGSKDNSYKKMEELYNKDKKHVRLINFSRNFGKEAAMLAGLKHAIGEYTVIIDSDLQQNPKYLIPMIEHLDNNPDTDQIAMVMKNRNKESFLNRTFKNIFYSLLNKLSDVKFVNGASDFRMFRRNVVEAILSLEETNRFSKGIFGWIGFNTEYMYYEVEERHSGKSKFNPKAQIKYAIEGILNFSYAPLRITTYTGLGISFAAFIYIIYLIIKTLCFGKDVPGFATIICVILLIGGIQLLMLGIIGEYIAKNYSETKRRPVYICKTKKGFKDNSLL